MQILLLGATGRTGLLVLKESLNRNHTITALVRNPDSLLLEGPGQQAANPQIANHHPNNTPKNLTTIAGSPLTKSDILTALSTSKRPVDVIITTLNPRRASDSPFAAPDPTDSPPRMMADGMASVLEAVDEYCAKTNATRKPKIIALSALGAGSSAPQANCLLRLMFRKTNMSYTYEDHDAVEEELTRQRDDKGVEGAVPYVIVRPTRLVEEGGAARVFEGSGTVGMMETISRGAVASFLVDAAERTEWDFKAPIIIG